MYKLYWRENSTNEWVAEGQFPTVIAALKYIVEEPAKKGEFGLWNEENSPTRFNVMFVDFNN